MFSLFYPFEQSDLKNTVNGAIQALILSSSNINFYEIKLITSKEVIEEYKDTLNGFGIKYEETIYPIKNINDYSKYMVYELYRHFDSKFILVTQPDGYVINPDQWDEEFLNYDYIGAPWPYREDAFLSPFGEHIRVGNGGFSLRSKKLCMTPLEVDIPFDCTSGDFYKHFNQNNFNEDGCIAVHNRHLFESNGCKFAPIELAAKFSYESPVPENYGITTFGFHGNRR